MLSPGRRGQPHLATARTYSICLSRNTVTPMLTRLCTHHPNPSAPLLFSIPPGTPLSQPMAKGYTTCCPGLPLSFMAILTQMQDFPPRRKASPRKRDIQLPHCVCATHSEEHQQHPSEWPDAVYIQTPSAMNSPVLVYRLRSSPPCASGSAAPQSSLLPAPRTAFWSGLELKSWGSTWQQHFLQLVELLLSQTYPGLISA